MKSPWRYWFWRIYVPLVWTLFAAIGLRWLTTLNMAYFRAAFCIMPFYVAAVIALCNGFVFPLDYGVFGKYRRAPLPTEAPLRTIGESWDSFRSWGASGRSNMGPVVWLLYRHGIGIKTSYGKVFVPLDEIDALDIEHGFDDIRFRRSTSTLYHHCPEIREPITVPKWAAKIMAAYYPSKVLVPTELAETGHG
jgi:hypothetical protein